MRKTIAVLTSCVVLLLIGYTCYRGYQVWKQNHGIAMAKAYWAKADARDASLSLQQVLAVNPRNVEACRMVANMTEAEHSPGALAWRERVLELAPDSFQDRLALAQAAIFDQKYSVASNALAGVSEENRKNALYQNIAGTAAGMAGRLDEAEEHFSEAIQLEPANPVPQMNLAVMRLHRTNALDLAEARLSLQRITLNSTNASIASQARRELIGDALRFKDYTAAAKLAMELTQPTNSAFGDKILRLEVLKKAQSADFGPVLASYQGEAANDPRKISELTKWQIENLSLTEAFDWLRQLPGSVRTNLSVEMLTATCQMGKRDWKGLQSFIQPQNWDDPEHPWNNHEFLRHAFLARSLRGQDLVGSSDAEWVVAVKSATEQRYTAARKSNFQALFELAADWKWNNEAEQILWTVINQYPEEKWAPQVLQQVLVSGRRTKSLMELLDIMHKRAPDDLNVKNDLATTALLLGENDLKPFELAQQVYEKAPKNPSYASTYAFSLYRQGKYADALKAMQQLDARALETPTIAGYYAIILKANGKKAEAITYLNLASKGQSLPEEQALFEQARAGL